MARNDEAEKVVIAEEKVADPSLTADQLMEMIGEAYNAKDHKLMRTLLKQHGEVLKAEEKSKKEALLAELVETTKFARLELTAKAKELVDSGRLDGAEGIWFVWEFGEKEEVGINPACRLVKTGKKASGESGGQSSYKAGLPPSEDMLKEIGDTVYLAEDTNVTINKDDQTLPAGMTYREAYEHSTNGGWRNRMRMALGRATGRI